jgi:hypothetical protein
MLITTKTDTLPVALNHYLTVPGCDLYAGIVKTRLDSNTVSCSEDDLNHQDYSAWHKILST